MHHRAAFMIEDGVVAIVAAKCETNLAALARTVMVRGAEIPAARPLQQISAKRRDVADLRTCRIARNVSQCRIALKNGGMAGEIGEPHHRAYAYGSVVRLDDPVEPGNAAKIYNAARLQQAFLDQVEKVDAAGLDHNGII